MPDDTWLVAYAVDIVPGDQIQALGDITRTVAECETTPAHNPQMRVEYDDGTSRWIGKLDRVLVKDRAGVAERLRRLHADAHAPIEGC